MKVLVIDDSSAMRALLSAFLEEAPFVTEVFTANDPYEGRDLIVKNNPDVVTLDVEMPRMDGITFLRKLMKHHPIPVIMVSTLTKQRIQSTLTALEAGAIDFIEKPQKGGEKALNDFGKELVEKVKHAATSQMKSSDTDHIQSIQFKKTLPAQNVEGKIIAIGASTGGLTAMKPLIEALPTNCPPVLIVQHLPKEFTQQVVNRFDTYTRHKVVLAKDNDLLEPGTIYFSPGNQHLQITNTQRLALTEGPKVNGHRPSVDVLFLSMAKNVGKNGIGVILTGMGNDGAQGLLAMRKSGAYTIGQDSLTSTIYGMPKVAYEIGAVAEQCGLLSIAQKIVTHLEQ